MRTVRFLYGRAVLKYLMDLIERRIVRGVQV